MLGKLIRVSITDPIGSPLSSSLVYKLNHGKPIGKFQPPSTVSGVFILGIDNPVRHFDGRIIAVIKFRDNGEQKLIAAPKSKKYIDCEIRELIEFYTQNRKFNLDCYYERSCGAVVYRKINNEIRYLLIRNRRSSNWSFPKGHVEKGETEEETAIREIKEETGLDVEIVDSFREVSDYCPFGRIKKRVVFFMAQTFSTNVVVQKEEIDSYIWVDLFDVHNKCTYDNDLRVIKKARENIDKLK